MRFPSRKSQSDFDVIKFNEIITFGTLNNFLLELFSGQWLIVFKIMSHIPGKCYVVTNLDYPLCLKDCLIDFIEVLKNADVPYVRVYFKYSRKEIL